MLEPYECEELIVKARERYKFDHELMYIAVRNAIGTSFGKGYKYESVFDKAENKKEVNEEEKQKLKEYFENW